MSGEARGPSSPPTTRARGAIRGSYTTNRRGCSSPWAPVLGQPRPVRRGRPSSSPPQASWGGETRCVTPRQTCPRPEGFGRNLRSKTRWFTGFCNSHQVSHFATFFIDARAEISVAESRFNILWTGATTARRRTGRGGHAICSCSLARSAPGFVVSPEAARWERPPAVGEGMPGTRPPRVCKRVHGSFC